MLFSDNELLEESCIRYLLHTQSTVKGLCKKLASEGKRPSIQGVYKALRLLISQEIVIKHGTLYSLSEEWRKKTLDALKTNTKGFELSEGERISFDLASLIHLDQQWKNIAIPLQEASPNQPIFIYNPHEIWPHLSESRKESEATYYGAFLKNKTYVFHAIGGSTSLDKRMKKELENTYRRMNVGIEYFKKTDYPTIFGDYIITTRLSPHLANTIELCYKESQNLESLEQKLRAIGIEKKKVKLIIERNREKAKKLRKKMSRDFFVPKELVEEFGLY